MVRSFEATRDGYPTEHLQDLLDEYARAFEADIFEKSIGERMSCGKDLGDYTNGFAMGCNMYHQAFITRREEALKGNAQSKE